MSSVALINKVIILVFTTWPECEVELDGNPYKVLVSKKVNDRKDADKEIRNTCELPIFNHMARLGMAKFAYCECDQSGEIIKIHPYELIGAESASGVMS